MSQSGRGPRGIGPVPFIATALVSVLLGLVAVIIALGQDQSRAHIEQTFRARAQATASLVGDYLSNLASNERLVAQANLGSGPVSEQTFIHVSAAFGFSDAILLDSRGVALAAAPANAKLLGTNVGRNVPQFDTAENGNIGVSGVITAPESHAPVVAIAVPFASTSGERIFSGSFALPRVPLESYLRNAIVSKAHEVFLLDGSGHVIASSPSTATTTLARAAPGLARAVAHASDGTYSGRFGASSFTKSSVKGTSWRLVIGEGRAALFRTTLGLTGLLPWLLFAALCAIALLLLIVFLRSLRDRRTLTRLSARMAIAAETDDLTGLANRRRLVRTLEAVAQGPRAADEPATVMLIDIDRFKTVNDTYGHIVGDETIVTVADAMRAVFRAGDVYGRWGGDEFVAVLSDTDAPTAAVVARRLRAELADLGHVSGGPPISISIGIASGGSDLDDLLRRADAAMYAAKAAGGNTIADEEAIASRA